MNVSQARRADIKLLAQALKNAKAPAIFGLLNISMESQRVALRLARTLGAYVSLERPASASFTYGTLSKFRLILNCAARELPEATRSFCGEIICSDALFSVNAWRYLRALAQNKRIPNLVDDTRASELDNVYKKLVNAGGAAIFIGLPAVSPMVYDQIKKFEDESRAVLDIGVIQLSEANLAGAYQIALEEFWGAPASLCGGKPKIDGAFHIQKLYDTGAIDIALLIGDSNWPFPGGNIGCPLYTLGSNELFWHKPVLSIPTARLGEDESGTILRDDLMPLSVEAKGKSGDSKLTDVLSALLEEVSKC